MKLSELITAKRKEAGITQQELADKLFVSVKSVSKWETGNGNPSLDLLPSISKALNISSEEMMNSLNNSETEEILTRRQTELEADNKEQLTLTQKLDFLFTTGNYSVASYIIFFLFGLVYFILCSQTFVVFRPISDYINASFSGYYLMGHSDNIMVILAITLIFLCILSVVYWIFIPVSFFINKKEYIKKINKGLSISNLVLSVILFGFFIFAIVNGFLSSNTYFGFSFYLTVILEIGFTVYFMIITFKPKASKKETKSESVQIEE